MKTTVKILVALISVAFSGCTPLTVTPKNGYVPDESTAVRIAEAVWTPIYGKETIEKERPFVAALRNGVWTVQGTLQPGMKGGVAIAEISKVNGRIIRVIHEK